MSPATATALYALVGQPVAGNPTQEMVEAAFAAAGIDAAYAIDDLPPGEVGHTPEESLAALASRVARTWSR